MFLTAALQHCSIFVFDNYLSETVGHIDKYYTHGVRNNVLPPLPVASVA